MVNQSFLFSKLLKFENINWCFLLKKDFPFCNRFLGEVKHKNIISFMVQLRLSSISLCLTKIQFSFFLLLCFLPSMCFMGFLPLFFIFIFLLMIIFFLLGLIDRQIWCSRWKQKYYGCKQKQVVIWECMQACEISFLSSSIVVKFSVSFPFFFSLSLSLSFDVINEAKKAYNKSCHVLIRPIPPSLLDTSLMARQFDIKITKYNCKK